MIKFKAVDLFSGAGGVSEALKKYFEIKLAIEFDPVHARTYSLNHGKKHLCVKDATKININDLKVYNLKNIDLLVSTPPCQGFSRHTRKAINDVTDERNNLILETVKFAHIIKPRYIFFENVPGIIYFKVFHKMVRDLNNLKASGERKNLNKPSYRINFKVVSVSDYNVPQKRKRLILIGERIDGLTSQDDYLSTIKREVPVYRHSIGLNPLMEKAPFLGEFLSHYNLTSITAGERCSLDPLHVASDLNQLNLRRIMATPHNGGSRLDWDESLMLECHKRKNVGYGDVYGRMNFQDYAPTITGGCNSYSKGRFGHPTENRAISLREAALIQTFPPDYIFVGDLHSEPNYGSKTKIALQIGNAVPVLLAEAFIKAIYDKLLE